jgi:hypothetical protein
VLLSLDHEYALPVFRALYNQCVRDYVCLDEEFHRVWYPEEWDMVLVAEHETMKEMREELYKYKDWLHEYYKNRLQPYYG